MGTIKLNLDELKDKLIKIDLDSAKNFYDKFICKPVFIEYITDSVSEEYAYKLLKEDIRLYNFIENKNDLDLNKLFEANPEMVYVVNNLPSGLVTRALELGLDPTRINHKFSEEELNKLNKENNYIYLAVNTKSDEYTRLKMMFNDKDNRLIPDASLCEQVMSFKGRNDDISSGNKVFNHFIKSIYYPDFRYNGYNDYVFDFIRNYYSEHKFSDNLPKSWHNIINLCIYRKQYHELNDTSKYDELLATYAGRIRNKDIEYLSSHTLNLLRNIKYITELDNPSEELLILASLLNINLIDENNTIPDLIKVKNGEMPTEGSLTYNILKVLNNPYYILNLDNPSMMLKVIAFYNEPSLAFKYTEDIFKVCAVINNPRILINSNIPYNNKLWYIALHECPELILELQYPTEEMIYLSLIYNPDLINKFNKPSKYMQLIALVSNVEIHDGVNTLNIELSKEFYNVNEIWGNFELEQEEIEIHSIELAEQRI